MAPRGEGPHQESPCPIPHFGISSGVCSWLKRLHISCYKMQKCVNLAAGWTARPSSVISAFAYQQPIENGFACSGGEPAQKCGLCSLRLGLFGVFLLCRRTA